MTAPHVTTSETDSASNPPTPIQAGTMSMTAHLEELRQRLMIIIGAALVGIIAAFYYALPVIELLKGMANPILIEAHGLVEFVQLTPGEVLMASLKLSIFLGLAAASPVILFQVLRFISPGLAGKEKWSLFGIVVGGTGLFIAGICFAYFLVVPSALSYLLEYGQQVAKSQISIAQYIDFCLSLLLLTGIVFELPLLLFFLSFTGLVSSRQLASQWRMAIVIIAVAAAVLTPSQDPFTLIIVGSAMAALYFLSIIPIRLIGR